LGWLGCSRNRKGNDIEAIIAGMNDAKSELEKENQYVYVAYRNG
jgi:hypothetical protein